MIQFISPIREKIVDLDNNETLLKKISLKHIFLKKIGSKMKSSQ